MTRKQIVLGVDVIVDSPLRFRADFERVTIMASELGARTCAIRVTCSDVVLWRARLEERNSCMPDHRRWSWEYHQERYGNSTDAEPAPGECVVDSCNSVESNLPICTAYIERFRNRSNSL